MNVYTLKKKNKTEEHHLFEGKWVDNNSPRSCSVPAKSICKKADSDDSVFVEQNCLTEAEARKIAAEMGRKVCGSCVSHLYATFE